MVSTLPMAIPEYISSGKFVNPLSAEFLKIYKLL